MELRKTLIVLCSVFLIGASKCDDVTKCPCGVIISGNTLVCVSPCPTPSPEISPSPEPTPIPTPTPIITPSPTPEPSPIITPTPMPTPDVSIYTYTPPANPDCWRPLEKDPDWALFVFINERTSELTGCSVNSDCNAPPNFIPKLITLLKGATLPDGRRIYTGSQDGNIQDTLAFGTAPFQSVAWQALSGSGKVRWLPARWLVETRWWFLDITCIAPWTPIVCTNPTPPPLCEIACNKTWILDCVPRVCGREYCDSQGFINRNECPPRGEGATDRVICEQFILNNTAPHAKVLEGNITLKQHFEDNKFNMFDVEGSGRFQVCNYNETVCSKEMSQ